MPNYVQLIKMPKILLPFLKPEEHDLKARKGCKRCHQRGVTGYQPDPDASKPRGQGRPILCRCVMADMDLLMLRKAAAEKKVTAVVKGGA